MCEKLLTLPICIYKSDTRTEFIKEMTGALTYMDKNIWALVVRILEKLCSITDAKFAAQALNPAEDD